MSWTSAAAALFVCVCVCVSVWCVWVGQAKEWAALQVEGSVRAPPQPNGDGDRDSFESRPERVRIVAGGWGGGDE